MALQSNPWLGNTRDPNQQQKVQHIIFVTPEAPQQAPQPQAQQQDEHRGLLKIPTSIKTAPYAERCVCILCESAVSLSITVKPLNDGKLSSHEKIPSLRGFRL